MSSALVAVIALLIGAVVTLAAVALFLLAMVSISVRYASALLAAQVWSAVERSSQARRERAVQLTPITRIPQKARPVSVFNLPRLPLHAPRVLADLVSAGRRFSRQPTLGFNASLLAAAPARMLKSIGLQRHMH